MNPDPLLRRPIRRRSAALVLLAATLLGPCLLGGCADLRLETPPPTTPTPDAAELVRDRTAREAVHLAELATRAAPAAPESVATVLGLVADTSVAHADALGGVYEAFPDSPDAGQHGTAGPGQDSPTDGTDDGASAADGSPAGPPEQADVSAVLSALAAAAEAARTDADAVDDGDLGRLLASVWVSRALLTERLDAAAREVQADPDAPQAQLPEPPPWAAMTPGVPNQLPAGLGPGEAAVIIQFEDAVGFAWEVVAARSADDARERATTRATRHRALAEAWAVAAGLARTADDPRRAAYELPDALLVDGATAEAMAGATADLERAVADRYGSLVAVPDPGARGPVLDLLLDQVRLTVSDGGAVPAFPALPART